MVADCNVVEEQSVKLVTVDRIGNDGTEEAESERNGQSLLVEMKCCNENIKL